MEREGSVSGSPCPLQTDTFGFLRYLAKGDIQKALDKIRDENPFPGVTGRLGEDPFEETQVFDRSGARISLRALERFVADHGSIKGFSKNQRLLENHKIAVIGSGPTGLTASAILAKHGYPVTIFESLHLAGGVLRYVLPEFRMPSYVVKNEITYLSSLGVEWKMDHFVGQTITIEELLKEGFQAVLLTTGARLPQKLGISGEDLAGVIYAEDFLFRMNLLQARDYPRYETRPNVGQQVVVIGEGERAFDSARICARLGCKVGVMVEGTEDDLQISSFMKEAVMEEGVEIFSPTKPLEMVGDQKGCVRGIQCCRLDFADPNGDGQWQVIEVPHSQFLMEADTVIIAVGYQVNQALLRKLGGWKIRREGIIWTDENSSLTSQEPVFAAGEVAQGPISVIDAMVSGKDVAMHIHAYLIELPSNK